MYAAPTSLVELSATRLNRDDWADGAALDEELLDDVVLDTLDGQPDVDVFRQGPAVKEERVGVAGGESESAVCLRTAHCVTDNIGVRSGVCALVSSGVSVCQGWGRYGYRSDTLSVYL